MPLIETNDVDQVATIEIFRDLAAEADSEFESSSSNPHAPRVAAIAEEIGQVVQSGTRDRFRFALPRWRTTSARRRWRAITFRDRGH